MALTESVYLGSADHRDVYTHSVLYQHAEHERRRTYARWFWTGGRAAAAMGVHDALARRCLIRFRLGGHGLQVSQAAWASGGSVDRIHRLCKCCSMDIVEDEVHLIFECSLYHSLRQQYSSLFSDFSMANGSGLYTIILSANTEEMMQRFMGQPDQSLIGKFVAKCLLTRSKQI